MTISKAMACSYVSQLPKASIDPGSYKKLPPPFILQLTFCCFQGSYLVSELSSFPSSCRGNGINKMPNFLDNRRQLLLQGLRSNKDVNSSPKSLMKLHRVAPLNKRDPPQEWINNCLNIFVSCFKEVHIKNVQNIEKGML